MGNLELNEYDFSTIVSVHDLEQGSLYLPSPGLDWRTLDAPIASLLSRVTAGENELKQAKENSVRVNLLPRNTVHLAHADIKA